MSFSPRIAAAKAAVAISERLVSCAWALAGGSEGEARGDAMRHCCLTCRYTHRLPEDFEENPGDFECRRHAPQAVFAGEEYTFETLWPQVGAFDTCGEWEDEDE